MAVSGRWKMLAALSAAALALAGCGNSTSSNKDKNATDGDGDAGDNGGSNGPNNGGNMDGGAQVPIANLDDDVAGDACNSDTDCKGENATCATTVGGFTIMGMTIGGNPAPGGYCSGACNDDSNCGKGGACVGSIPGILQGNCQQTCKAKTDCRDKYECSMGFTPPEGGIPGAGDAGIPGGGMIPPQPSTCTPIPETDMLADGKVGNACSADADCGGGVCKDMIGGIEFFGQSFGAVAAPGKYCSGACTMDAQCGKGGICVKVVQGQVGTCYLGCAKDSECTRDGYTCRAPFGGGGGGGGFPGGGMPGGMMPGGGGNLPEVCFPGMDDADAGM